MTEPSNIDWSLLQSFLAVAEHGSLTAAAHEIGASQPTLGRHVRELEDQLGAELFHRHDRGLAPTELGASLVALARTMGDAARGIQLRAAGQGGSIAGTVRITASEVVAMQHLPRLVTQLRIEEPRIFVEIVPSDETSRLHFREADIAIRMYRPQQLDLVAYHVGDLSLIAYASREYIERRGMPCQPSELSNHDVVGRDRGREIIDGFRRGGFDVDREFFPVRTDHTGTYMALVRAGAGIGFTQRAMVARDPDLVEIPLELGLPALPIWLTAHEAIRPTPRVRYVWDFLVRELGKIVD